MTVLAPLPPGFEFLPMEDADQVDPDLVRLRGPDGAIWTLDELAAQVSNPETYAAERQPTWWEQQMSLDKIDQSITGARDQFQQAAADHVREIAADVASRVNAGRNPKTDLTRLEAELYDQLAALYRTGKATVQEELARQVPSRSAEKLGKGDVFAAPDGEQLPAELAKRAKVAAEGIFGRIVQTIKRLTLSGRKTPAQLQQAGEDAGTAGLRAEAMVHAAPALNLGRSDEADDHADEILGSRYTSILDKNRCEQCQGADDDVLRPLSDPLRLHRRPPNPDCYGGDRCRCMEFFQLKEEAAPHFAAPFVEREHPRWPPHDKRGGRFRPKVGPGRPAVGADGISKGPGSPEARPPGGQDHPGNALLGVPPTIAEEWALGPTLRGRKILGGHANTVDQHTLYGKWTPKRAKLHAEILRKFLDGNFIEQDDGSFTWERAPHTPKEHPEMLSTAGGGASGKSRMLEANPSLKPDDAIVINPDIVKSQLPEYQKLLDTHDPFAAGAVHEESSYIARLLADQVTSNGYNAVLDVVGDSGPGRYVSKLRAFHRAGYKVRVAYASVSTKTALARAKKREKRTGRHLDTRVLQDAHRETSKRFAEVASADWIDRIEVWDNEGDTELIASGPGGKGIDGLNIIDHAAFDAFIAKRNERGLL